MSDFDDVDISLIRARDLARALSIDRVTLWRWVRDGIIPPPLKWPENVRLSAWRKRDIARLLDERAPRRAL
jgi:predicted DNA-binding transcriptional regulator AlpA